MADQDPLPTWLCKSCVNRLDISYEFKRRVESSETELWKSIVGIRRNILTIGGVEYTLADSGLMTSNVVALLTERAAAAPAPETAAVAAPETAATTTSATSSNAPAQLNYDAAAVDAQIQMAEQSAKIAPPTNVLATEHVTEATIDNRSAATVVSNDDSKAADLSSSVTTTAAMDIDSSGQSSGSHSTPQDTASAGFFQVFNGLKMKRLSPYISADNRKIYDEQELKCLCAMCPSLSFDSRHSFARHCRNVHGIEPKLYTCDYCLVQFGTFAAFKRHLSKVHVNPRQFKCLTCAEEFDARIKVKLHVRRYHNNTN